MLNAIIYNLKSPHKIPQKILKKIVFLYKKRKFKSEPFIAEQNKKFEDKKLDRIEGGKKLDEIKKKYNFLIREMSSEHELLFSSISIKSEININNILEIGTFDGANSFLLSKLFENSKIETIDLKSNEKEFYDFYNRKDNLKNFINDRNALLDQSKNVAFHELNSVKLILSKKKYDLIWIDGAHGYPVCCIDIIISLKKKKKKGFIMVDDISLKLDENDKMYESVAGYETLRELKKNNVIEFDLFYKRLDAHSNCDEKKIKYVALVKKTNE